jgi:hypothetical protein
MRQQAFMFGDPSPADWVYSCPPGRDGQYRWRAHRIQKVTEKCLYVTRRSVSLRDRDAGVIPAVEEKPYRLTRVFWERDGWHRHTDCRRSCLYAQVDMERQPSPDEIAEVNRRRYETEQREREAWEAANPEAAAERRRQAEERLRQSVADLEETMRRIYGRRQAHSDFGTIRFVPMPDHAADARTLGVAWPCTSAELKSAYRRLAKATHPDRGGSSEEFRRVNEAYERLQVAAVEARGAWVS